MLGTADDAILAVDIEFGPAVRLAEGSLCRHAARRGGKEIADHVVLRPADVPIVERIGHRRAVHGGQCGVQQPGFLEFAEDRHDTACAVDVFHMDVALGRGDFRQARHLAAQPVDILHGEIDPRLMRGGEQVEYRIGRAAHRDVEAHRVLERLETGDRARQDAFIVFLVIALGQRHHEAPCPFEQALAIRMRRQRRAIAG